MVLAAGRGARLRPITDTLPKPMVEVGGRTLLDHAIDRLELAGVERVVVNVHHLAEQIVEHLAHRNHPEIVISPEKEALETGGAIVKALELLGPDPFYIVNGDSLWLDGGRRGALARLAECWATGNRDVILLFQRTATAVGYDDGHGDFALDQLGQVAWRHEHEIVPYLYAGVQLVTPALFRGLPPERFSVRRIWDKAMEAGRLGAIVHDGEWYHVSTPPGLELVRERFGTRRVER